MPPSTHQDCRSYEDGHHYLVIEPSIKCTDKQYRDLLPTIVGLCIIVTVGFPLAYFLLLRHHSKGINPIVLGRFNNLGEGMASANKRLASAQGARKKSLFHSGPMEVTSVNQKTSDYWAEELFAILRIDMEQEVLRSTSHKKCAELIKRAYTVKLSLLGPAYANYWLQEGKRACDPKVESSRFLWVSKSALRPRACAPAYFTCIRAFTSHSHRLFPLSTPGSVLATILLA